MAHLEGGGFSRDDQLAGRVRVGDRDHPGGARLPDQLLDHRTVQPQDGRHASRPRIPALLHQPAPLPDQPQRGLEVDDVGGHQRRELAQAVPGDVAGGDRLARRVPALAERVEAGDAHGEYGRLGVYGVVQLLRRALEAEPREGEPQDLVSLLENPAGRLRDLVEGLAHAYVLRSLTGKHEGDRAGAEGGLVHADVAQATWTFPLT